jgi:6-phosphogluconolactonase
VSLDRDGKYLLVANFTGGSFGVIRLETDGSLGKQTSLVQQEGSGPNPQWQPGSRAHWAGFSPDGRFVLVMNLGNDRVYVYRFDAATGTVTPNDPAFLKMPAGYGPRNLLFHPNGRIAYLVNQLGGTLVVFEWDAARGALRQIQEVSLKPPGFDEEFNGGEEVLDRDAKFLYVACRGSDTLAVFSVHPATGMVTLVQHESSRGMSPRHIALDPDGKTLLVANQYTDNLLFLGVNAATGRLKRIVKVVKITAVAYIQFVAAQ